jgi:CHAT domain-containing protein/Tfp pilus assembly protein PilF
VTFVARLISSVTGICFLLIAAATGYAEKGGHLFHRLAIQSWSKKILCRNLVLIVCGLLVIEGQAQSRSRQSPVIPNLQEVARLELGVALKRELAGRQKHTYEVELSAGQYLKIEIRQHGINLAATLRMPDGGTRKVLDVFGSTQERSVELIAESPGVYRLDVYAGQKASPGSYEIRIAELRIATKDDQALQTARKLFNQAFMLNRDGKYLEARPLLIRALQIREKVLGPDDFLVAITLDNLATNHSSGGDYATAVTLRERSLTIKEKIRGPVHLDVAYALHGLGIVYHEKGDYVKAREVFQRALNIYELNQTENLNVGSLLAYLGDNYYSQDDFVNAESYYERSRVLYEKLLGPDNFHLSDSLSASGLAAYARGDYPKAETMFQRALTLTEKVAPGRSRLSPRLNNLAMLYGTTGDYAKAEALYRRVLSIQEQEGAIINPAALEAFFGLTRIYSAQGRLPEAVELQTRASENEEYYLDLNLRAGSEREKLSLIATLSSHLFRNISLHTSFAPDDPNALNLAATSILRRKGRVQDTMSEGLAALRRHLSAEDQRLLDQLNEVASRLANLTLNGSPNGTLAERQQQVKALEMQKDELETEISRRSAGFYDRPKTIRLDSVQAVIPERAALIEFAVYQPFNPKAPDNLKAFGEPRYVAYVIRQRNVLWKELGEAKMIDERLHAFRDALTDPKRDNVKQLARDVDEKVMQPLRALIGDATQVFISPDGEFNLLPFEALLDEHYHYLVERYSFSYLTSGRDLLRLQVPRNSRSNAIVFANPSFGESESKHSSEATPAEIKSASFHPRQAGGKRRQSVTTGTDLSGVYFAPLSGTAQEALTIKSLFPEARVLTGNEASESSFKQVSAPSIVHIATHGFFLTDSPAASRTTERLAGINARIENPLLRSGLALAGANLKKAGANDGILTALEASGLNLWGTKLVVLSACDTGIGVVRNGEGVYGLRRAFVLAGAESLVMSLWSVSDRSARDMMKNYYINLKKGMGRGEALRQVQLQIIKRNPQLHPFYWANFIQSGEWANLDGRR